MPLSASQVLEIQPIPPPILPSPSRATSESLRDKRNHGPFVIAPAAYIDPSIVNRFRAYIRSIRIDFSAVSSTLPSAFPGLLLCNKADVQQFLDSQILIPVWPVILSMLPDPPIRNYDWFLCNERASSVSDDGSSLPDKIFLKLFRRFDASGMSTLLSDSAVIIEVKAPGLVDGCKPTFDNGKAMITDSWVTMTSQLRKYARVHKCQHLVLIDERSVFYFYLKRITENEDFDVEFIAASAPSTSNILPLIDPLTVREVIAFAAWNALNTTQSPRLKNYSDSTTISGDRFPMFSYQTLYGSPALPAAPSPENLPNRGQSGYKPQELSPEPIKKSVDITLHSCYEISLDQSDYNDDDIGLRCSTIFLSHDGTYQGVQNSDDTTTSLYLTPFVGKDVSEGKTPYTVIQELGEDLFLAVFAPGDELFVLKRFGRQLCYLQYELEAYNALNDIQGFIIPVCCGVYKITISSTIIHGQDYFLNDGDGDGDALFLLLRYDHCTPLSSHNLTTSQLSSVEEKTLFALWELHSRRVVHNNLKAENILISALGVVTIVNFEQSLYNQEGSGLSGRQIADRAFLRKTFLQACENLQ